jgi:hypothetical protein
MDTLTIGDCRLIMHTTFIMVINSIIIAISISAYNNFKEPINHNLAKNSHTKFKGSS